MKKTFMLALICAGMLGSFSAAPLSADAALDRNTAVSSRAKAGQNGWVTEGNKRYYYIDGQKASGPVTIDSKVYFFDLKTGEQKTGLVTYKGKKYFFSPKSGGARRSGWVYYQKNNYYFGKNGAALKGIHQIGSYRYYFDKKGVLVKNALVRGRYYAGSRGRFVTGWQEVNGQRYYFSPKDYRALTGWQTINGKRYKFNDDGTLVRLSGIVTSDDKGRYYYDPQTGEQKTGWVDHGKYRYYFSPKTGRALKGWQTINGKKYYFKSNGILVRSRFVGKKYYVNENGERVCGWLELNGKTYYLDKKTGVAAKNGWYTIDGKKYYFLADKTLAKNAWINDDQYLDENGSYAVGFREIDGKTYYFSQSSKKKVTGWKRISGKVCHFGDDGALIRHSGLTSSGSGFLYYFDPITGEAKKGWINTEGRDYYFSQKTGRALKGWHTIDGKKYYFDKNKVLVKSKFIGSKYYVDETGARVFGWQTIGTNTYYFNSSTGVKFKSWHTIDGKTYHFNNTGILSKSVWVKDRYLQEDGSLAKNTWIGAFQVGPKGYKTGKTRSPGIFIDENKDTYYLDGNYQYITGWQTVEGKTYHFDPTTGKMDKNKWVDGYYLNAQGERTSGAWMTIEGKTYLFLADGSKARGLTEYQGNKYYFNSTDGSLYTGFKVIDNMTYYFNPAKNGAMAVSTELEIDGVFYSFDANGHMTSKEQPSANEALGKRIALYGQKFIGYPYVWGGDKDLTKGVDCSGFTMLVMKHFGIQIPRTTWQQYDGVSGYKKPLKIPVESLKPGDLIFYYAGNTHVGIYIGDGKIVHASNSAPYPQGGIKISSYDYAYIYGCVRYWYDE